VIQARIFIVGCPRSGTTLLQSMLANRSDVFSFPETHILQYGIGRNGRQIITSFGRLSLLNGAFINIYPGKAIKNPKDAFKIFFSAKYLVRFMICFLDMACIESKHSIWVEKTPEHLFYIKYIQDIAPETKFVHVVRDGGPVVVSIVDMWNEYMRDWPFWRKSLTFINDILRVVKCYTKYVKGYRFDLFLNMLRYRRYIRASELWNDSVLETKKYIGKSNHYVCFYEEITSNPKEGARDLTSFLNIPFLTSMLHPEQSSISLIHKNETWKSDNFLGIRPASYRKFDSLPQEVRDLLTTILISSGNGNKAIYGSE